MNQFNITVKAPTYNTAVSAVEEKVRSIIGEKTFKIESLHAAESKDTLEWHASIVEYKSNDMEKGIAGIYDRS